MTIPKLDIEITGKPLFTSQIDELVLYSGYDIHLIMRYVKDKKDKGIFLIYAKYHHVIRQIYTQKNKPRHFKDIHRAIEWGKQIGFRTATFTIDYDEHPLAAQADSY